jgi:Tol biopolymer transport system component
LTDFKGGVTAFSWSPDSKKLAVLVADPDPDEKDEKEVKKDEPQTSNPIVITRLQFLFDEYDFLKELYHHIFVFDVESRTSKQITFGPYDDGGPVWSDYDSEPQWSPDGKQILFVSNRSENPDANRNTDLFLVPAGGGDLKQLTTNPGTDNEPSWSPDGKWITYQTQVQPDLIWYDTVEVALMPATGGTPKPLTRELDRNGFRPQFSADGRRV